MVRVRNWVITLFGSPTFGMYGDETKKKENLAPDGRLTIDVKWRR